MSTDDLKEKETNKSNESASETVTEVENSVEVNEDEEISTDLNEHKDEKEEFIQELQNQLAQTKDALLRKAAELENVRKRVQKERVMLFEDAKINALEDFLGINDDLTRTLGHAEESNIEDNFLAGIQLIASKFNDVLSKNGVKVINETNVPFDVNLHDALLRQPTNDEKITSDTVLQVVENGYKIGERTIRHAKVIVSE